MSCRLDLLPAGDLVLSRAHQSFGCRQYSLRVCKQLAEVIERGILVVEDLPVSDEHLYEQRGNLQSRLPGVRPCSLLQPGSELSPDSRPEQRCGRFDELQILQPQSRPSSSSTTGSRLACFTDPSRRTLSAASDVQRSVLAEAADISRDTVGKEHAELPRVAFSELRPSHSGSFVPTPQNLMRDTALAQKTLASQRTVRPYSSCLLPASAEGTHVAQEVGASGLAQKSAPSLLFPEPGVARVLDEEDQSCSLSGFNQPQEETEELVVGLDFLSLRNRQTREASRVVLRPVRETSRR